MKLSEAIRNGAKLHPQAFCNYRTMAADGTIQTCVLGAAYEGLTGVLPPMGPLEGWLNDPDKLDPIERALADAFGVGRGVFDAVTVWNDRERLTREAIADRVEAQGL